MFSMHMKCYLMHNMTTTTLVTQCRSCAEQTSQQQLAAISCFVREGESAAEREFVLSVIWLQSTKTSKTNPEGHNEIYNQ